MSNTEQVSIFLSETQIQSRSNRIMTEALEAQLHVCNFDMLWIAILVVYGSGSAGLNMVICSSVIEVR